MITDQQTLSEVLNLSVLRRNAARQPSYENLVNLGIGLRREGQLDAALEVLQRAVKLDPHGVAGWSTSAQVYTDLGRFSQAPELFKRCLSCIEKKGGDLESAGSKMILFGFAASLMRLGLFHLAGRYRRDAVDHGTD